MAIDQVAAGQVATIVTHLEMRTPPGPRPLGMVPFRLERWQAPAPNRYRALFRRVGEPWLWFSRLVLDDTALAAIIHDQAIEIFALVDRSGIEVGLLELDFRRPAHPLIAYFGLIPELTGKGIGRWLMGEALRRLWRPGTEVVAVNTCTLDHPRALAFYLRHGFVAVARSVERFADPRLAGLIPRDRAPHVPLIG